MRTIHIHRILGLAAVLATVGSFLIELRGMLPSANEVSGSSKAGCDSELYEPVVRRLRAEPKPAGADRFKFLGADPHFSYYYDYATDRVSCVAQSKPKGPLVEASRLEPPDHTKQNVVLVCVMVVVLSGAGLRIVQMIRAEQSGK